MVDPIVPLGAASWMETMKSKVQAILDENDNGRSVIIIITETLFD